MGPKGTFTDLAAKKLFKNPETIYYDSVEDVFKFVDEGRGLGVAAVENSLEGSIRETLESLMNYEKIKICGEVTLDINMCLIKKKGTTEIKHILSHPHALAQCRGYLRREYPKAEQHAVESTATAMQRVTIMKDAAAIGSKETAEIYGLDVAGENIQDDFSQTRFISISKKECWGKKTSIIFAVKDEPGALYPLLKIFSDSNINLTKIESRPSRKKLGEYVFYVDFENGSLDKAGVEKMLLRIRERTTYFKSLGSY